MNYCCITQRFNSHWHHPHKKFMLASKSDKIICQMAYNSKVEALSDLSQGGNVSQLPPGTIKRQPSKSVCGVLVWTGTRVHKIIPESVLSLLTSSIWVCYDLMEVLFKASQRVLMLSHRVFSQLSITNTYTHRFMLSVCAHSLLINTIIFCDIWH